MPDSQASPALADTVRAALALPPHDQASLCWLLQRVTGAAPLPPSDPVADTELVTQAATGQDFVRTWLQAIASEPAAVQLQLLDDAVDCCEDPGDLAALQAARTQLLGAHPPLAVRRTVTAFTSLHPASVAAALAGLLLGLAALVRLLLRGLF
ncbi:MAG TPA: hypothetical protein VHL79_06415 [Ramlibacter sp.]|jgi:hypothetical protein|nr:hypothetical protein [Ramlibacter sp.]